MCFSHELLMRFRSVFNYSNYQHAFTNLKKLAVKLNLELNKELRYTLLNISEIKSPISLLPQSVLIITIKLVRYVNFYDKNPRRQNNARLMTLFYWSRTSRDSFLNVFGKSLNVVLKHSHFHDDKILNYLSICGFIPKNLDDFDHQVSLPN